MRRRGVQKSSEADEEERAEQEKEELQKKKGGGIAGRSADGYQLPLHDELFLLGLKGYSGTLSFWNESSFALRACMMIDLEFRGKIGVVKASRRRELPHQLLEVLDRSSTGDALLDEMLAHIGTKQKSICAWLDLFNGDDWSLFKSPYHMTRVRERIAKGLVDKGLLRTEQQGLLSTQRSITDKGIDAKRGISTTVVATLLNKGDHAVNENSMEFRKVIGIACAAMQAEFLDMVFDLQEVSSHQRSVAVARLEQVRRNFFLEADARGVVANLPVLNATLKVLYDKEE